MHLMYGGMLIYIPNNIPTHQGIKVQIQYVHVLQVTTSNLTEAWLGIIIIGLRNRG